MLPGIYGRHGRLSAKHITRDQCARTPIAQLASTMLFIVAMITRNERVQGALAVIFLGYQTSRMLRAYKAVS